MERSAASHGVKRRAGRPANEAKRERRREEILAAAVQLFAERGYSQADTQQLADLLGVGKGTIYRYFPSKRDLFLAAVDAAMQQLTDLLEEVSGSVEDPFQRMLTVTRVYLTFFAAHPEYVELILQERAQFRDRKKPTYFEHREAGQTRWLDLFQTLVDQGRLRPMPVDRVLDVLGDLLYGAMFTNYFVGRDRSPEEQAEELVDIALFGILSDTERARMRQAERAGGAGSTARAPAKAGSRPRKRQAARPG